MENYADAEFFVGKRTWYVKCDVALLCATQNESSKEDADMLINDGCYVVSEGANMPFEPEAIDEFHKNKILFGPGKASNVGGVAVTGLEMSQNSLYQPGRERGWKSASMTSWKYTQHLCPIRHVQRWKLHRLRQGSKYWRLHQSCSTNA